MKELITKKLQEYIKEKFGVDNFKVIIQVPKDTTNGDLATPVAMALAKVAKKSPAMIAADIAKELKIDGVSKIDVAGPGFINFFVDASNVFGTINEVLKEKENFGKGKPNKIRINVEYISANPTGWLHIGHARNAAYGSSLVNVMRFAGYDVDSEYYINDAGAQMIMLRNSVIERLKECYGGTANFDGADLYRGEDIKLCAQKIHAEFGDKYEGRLDDEGVQEEILEYAYKHMLNTLQAHLKEFKVKINKWYSERTLYTDKLVDKAIDKLRTKDCIYEQDGATFCATTKIKDDKDRVVFKKDGAPTYFASDIAYHAEKWNGGYSTLINVWGADHDGYVDRVKSAMTLSGIPEGALEIELMQLVKIERNGQEVKMSKRMGTSITIKEIMDEIGTDALRYFLVSRTQNSNMVIDLDKVIEKNNENPLFYVQYAHARCNQIIEKANTNTVSNFDKLQDPEKEIVKFIATYKDVVQSAALNREPHKITNFVKDLAAMFHSYYNSNKVIGDDKELTAQRVSLVSAIKQVIANGLNIIGVSAPDKM